MQQEQSSPPRRVIIIAPVGAYFGRVKKGIEWALGLGDAGKTECSVTLVVPENWMTNSGYKGTIARIQSDFSDEQLRSQFKSLGATCEIVNMEHEPACTVFLLNTLLPFLHNKSGSAAYVDMTSVPKEWIFACHYVAEFFDKDRVAFYYVKPRKPKMPEDFKDENEIQDPGLIPERVILSGPDATLKEWITEGTDNWKFFKTICEMIKEKIQPNRSILDTSISVKDLAKQSNKWITTAERSKKTRRTAEGLTRAKGHSDETEGLRSASKRLTQVRKFGLFVEELNTIRLTIRGYALGKSLFQLP